ncbi:hypothetical protein OG225_39320 [Nocardia sp. NBC_01377]|uniref:hypothetical protein n=1 Tax=Nocardia sp. NBC_01377 TaxID=2903595 RepID=UPI00324E1527
MPKERALRDAGALGDLRDRLALVRSESSAKVLEAAGAESVLGDLADLRTIRTGAAETDGVIHLAFSNDFTSLATLAAGIVEESAALAAMGEELVGSDRPLITVSGTPAIPGRCSTEADPVSTEGPVGGRGHSVTSVLDLASRGVRSAAIRLPRTVHNEGKGGFAGILTEAARRNGVSGLSGRRHPALARRARARRGRTLPTGFGEGSGGDLVARRRRPRGRHA